MKVYLAAPWDFREEAARCAAQIEGCGHTITEPWWTHANSTDDAELQRQAMADIVGVQSADFMIVLQLAKSEGKAVETGMAMAMGVPLVVVNPAKPESGYLGATANGGNLFHHLLHVVSTLDEALALGEKYWSDLQALVASEKAKLEPATEAK